MEDFINRTYTKKELGLMYFPESMPRTAVNHLMSWIRRCQPLWDELQEMGYEKTCKSFTPKQVKAIIDNLGEPGENVPLSHGITRYRTPDKSGFRIFAS